MTVTTLIVLAVLALAGGLFVFRAIPGVRAYFDFRGKRLITDDNMGTEWMDRPER